MLSSVIKDCIKYGTWLVDGNHWDVSEGIRQPGQSSGVDCAAAQYEAGLSWMYAMFLKS